MVDIEYIEDLDNPLVVESFVDFNFSKGVSIDEKIEALYANEQ